MAEDTKDAPGGDRRDSRSDRSDRGRTGPTAAPAGAAEAAGGFFRRKKVDYFSVNRVDVIDYKDTDTLRNFVGDRGKILPRRHTGLSAEHQRRLKRAIKRARNIALLPFAAGG